MDPKQAVRNRSISEVGLTRLKRRGALRNPDGSLRWSVWAPAASRVDLALLDPAGRQTRVALQPIEHEIAGQFAVTLPDVAEGQRYAYYLGDANEWRPDPCSLWQPDGVTGRSAVVSPDRFAWTDADWHGIERRDLAIYELHIGTFTDAGTFEAAIERLDALAELGITAIEVMPIAQFPGDRNWGYDGVLPYAAQNTYGGPHGLQRLVDAAHAKGLAVILDVVYNHFGPEAAYHREFGPYFTEKYKTPWGDAINYDDRGCDAVRDYVLDNARMWLDEFHLDGLRLDAVHAIFDLGATHILKEIGNVAAEVAAARGWPAHVIAESDLNDPRIISQTDRGGHGLDAQWSDDFHHSVHALLTGERRGYYVDYGEAEHLADVLSTPFLGAGAFSRARGRRHGAPPVGLSGDRFVVCIQNHDQVGNRAVGDRLTTIIGHGAHGPAKQRLAASLLLLAAHVPMLFMGEEYGEERPFPFFCSFAGKELIDAVRAGRRREFADFVDDPEQIPDPDARSTFESAKLSWSWSDVREQSQLRLLYADLLAARKRWPAMHDFERRTSRLLNDNGVIELTRGVADQPLVAYFNLTDHPQPLPTLVPSVAFSSQQARYGGERDDVKSIANLLPFECIVYAKA